MWSLIPLSTPFNPTLPQLLPPYGKIVLIIYKSNVDLGFTSPASTATYIHMVGMAVHVFSFVRNNGYDLYVNSREFPYLINEDPSNERNYSNVCEAGKAECLIIIINKW